MIRALVLTLVVPLLLSGCAALGALGAASTPIDAYEVRASEDAPVASTRPQQVDLIVEVPTSSAALDTESILIRPQPNQVQYLPDARWIEPAPLMIQSALVDGLERSRGFRYVGRRPLGPSGDYALVISLAEFNAALVPDSDQAVINVRLTARLVREDDLAIVATRTFVTAARVATTETAVLVDGFDEAATEALDQLIAWVLSSRGISTTTP